MDMPVNVPIDHPDADTEWNDILRKHKIIPEKPPSPTQQIQEALREAQQKAFENRLEEKDLDELDALEDEEDEDFLEQYRKQRIAELATIQQTSVFNQVYPLQKPDYSRDVTEASNSAFVLVNLTSSLGNNTESRLLTELWRELARKFGDIKFCEMRADLCIEGYPERNTPTILVYHKGDIVRQVITLRELGGTSARIHAEADILPIMMSIHPDFVTHEAPLTVPDLQKMLIDVGAIKDNDTRILQDKKDAVSRRNARQKDDEDDDSDWD